MKKVILIALMLISVKAFSQDTTHVRNLSLQTRVIEYITPMMTDLGNDSLHTAFLNLRAKFRVQNPPTGTTTVVIDSIGTADLATLYNYTLSNSDGMSASAIMKSQLTSARAANTYLDSLCTGYETFWMNRLIALRISGRKLLTGK